MFRNISDVSKTEPLSFIFLRVIIIKMTGPGCQQSTGYGNLLQELVFFLLLVIQGKVYYQFCR